MKSEIIIQRQEIKNAIPGEICNAIKSKSSSFTAAELWNIQRGIRSKNTRRFL